MEIEMEMKVLSVDSAEIHEKVAGLSDDSKREVILNCLHFNWTILCQLIDKLNSFKGQFDKTKDIEDEFERSNGFSALFSVQWIVAEETKAIAQFLTQAFTAIGMNQPALDSLQDIYETAVDRQALIKEAKNKINEVDEQ